MLKIKKFIVFLMLIIFAFSMIANAQVIPSWPRLLIGKGVATSLQMTLLKIASQGTEPIIKTHEEFRKGHFYSSHPALRWVKIFNQACKALVFTLPSAALRALACQLQNAPYVHFQQSSVEDKVLPEDRKFTLLSWNLCFVGGGYAMSDGGVSPWSNRIDRVVEKIAEADADINALYEVFDTDAAFYVYEKLKEKGYNHFYFCIGAKAIGPSSGIFVASKYALKNPEFTLFPLESLVGRTKFATKGVFSFDVISEGKSFARIFATHLQHSEEPGYPTQAEFAARKMQMEIILKQMNRHQNQNLILTGDLNLDDQEYQSSSWQSLFHRGTIDFRGQKTWGGDQFSALIMNKTFSPPANLDHTMIFNGSALSVLTRLIETGFDGSAFSEHALSDHAGLFSEFALAPFDPNQK